MSLNNYAICNKYKVIFGVMKSDYVGGEKEEGEEESEDESVAVT